MRHRSRSELGVSLFNEELKKYEKNEKSKYISRDIKYGSDVKNKIIELYRDGMQKHKIADELHVHRSIVYSTIRDYEGGSIRETANSLNNITPDKIKNFKNDLHIGDRFKDLRRNPKCCSYGLLEHTIVVTKKYPYIAECEVLIKDNLNDYFGININKLSKLTMYFQYQELYRMSQENNSTFI